MHVMCRPSAMFSFIWANNTY